MPRKAQKVSQAKKKLHEFLEDLEEEFGLNDVYKAVMVEREEILCKYQTELKKKEMYKKHPEASTFIDMIKITHYNNDDQAYPRFTAVTASIDDVNYNSKYDENANIYSHFTYKKKSYDLFGKPEEMCNSIMELLKILKITSVRVGGIIDILVILGEIWYPLDDFSEEQLSQCIPDPPSKSARSSKRTLQNSTSKSPPRKRRKLK